MPLESTTTISGLTSSWPLSNDTFGGTDDHLRVIKSVLKTTFPGSGGQGFSKPILATEDEINRLVGVTGNVQNQIAARALLDSPALTGTPTAPTATQGTNTTQLATTAFVTTGINLKADIASPTFTGVPACPTPAVGINTTQIINAAWAKTGIGNNFSSNGHITLPSWLAGGNSLIIQWQKITGVSGSSSGTVTFFKPFPTAVLGISFFEKATAATGGITDSIGYNVVSLSNVTYSKPSNRDEFYCIAIGY